VCVCVLSLDSFSLTFTNVFLTLLGGGGDDTHPPYGSATATSYSATCCLTAARRGDVGRPDRAGRSLRVCNVM